MKFRKTHMITQPRKAGWLFLNPDTESVLTASGLPCSYGGIDDSIGHPMEMLRRGIFYRPYATDCLPVKGYLGIGARTSEMAVAIRTDGMKLIGCHKRTPWHRPLELSPLGLLPLGLLPLGLSASFASRVFGSWVVGSRVSGSWVFSPGLR